jgi:hypothetical protein
MTCFIEMEFFSRNYDEMKLLIILSIVFNIFLDEIFFIVLSVDLDNNADTDQTTYFYLQFNNTKCPLLINHYLTFFLPYFSLLPLPCAIDATPCSAQRFLFLDD